MNQNLTYTYTTDPRGNQQQSQQMRDHLQGLSFHPSSYQTSTYTTTTPSFQHQAATNAAFLQSNVLQSVQQQNRAQQPQTIRLTQDNEDKRIASMMETYFIEPNASTSTSWNNAVSHAQNVQVSSQIQPQISYTNGTLVATTGNVKAVPKMGISVSPDKTEKERLKKARQAEAARMRYHRLTAEEKRELNLKRTLAQKRKRQREKELEELDSILRETNDIQEDPDITEQLREKRMRAKWAEAARARYARMTPDERRAHNNRRRMRQMQNALAAVKASSDFSGLQAVTTGDPLKDEEAVRQHIKNQNAKKAEAARQRYHRMTEEEKRMYNQRRTEAFRRRRMEEEMLLAMPIGRINGEALDRAQQIVVRNAKRAEAARARYQRMTPDQRKSYNQKRYTPKRRGDRSSGEILGGGLPLASAKKEDMDALSSLERDVMKRTQQAQQALMRQGQRVGPSGPATPGPQGGGANQTGGGASGSGGGGTYIIQQSANQTSHMAPQQQVVHVTHQMPLQSQQSGSQHSIIGQQQQQQSFQGLPTSQSGHQIVVHHQTPAHQVTYSGNGSMMMNGGQQQHVQQQQQVINPYGAPQQRN